MLYLCCGPVFGGKTSWLHKCSKGSKIFNFGLPHRAISWSKKVLHILLVLSIS